MNVPVHDLRNTVRQIVDETPVVDMHTHIYPPSFGPLLLWGIDELLSYHYLAAEIMRIAPVSPQEFWHMPKVKQADLIWEHLFVRRSPVSEACRGVLTCMNALGLDVSQKNLNEAREFFRSRNVDDYTELIFKKANVTYAVMTNDPFDPVERDHWLKGSPIPSRFKAVLRVDPLLLDWNQARDLLREQGYEVGGECGEADLAVVRNFLMDWAERMKPIYLAVSLPPSFTFPGETPRTRVIQSAILPCARELNIPFAMMIGVKKLLNPALQLAGDSVGRADLSSVEHLCLNYPENRFLVTLLSRENQHEICVIARKFSNLLPFGCWWFVNNPSIIEMITRQRFELLGLSFVPQHSDARVLDQLIYKWPHSRRIIAQVLADKYEDVTRTGWPVTGKEIRRDVARLFSGNFEEFVGLR